MNQVIIIVSDNDAEMEKLFAKHLDHLDRWLKQQKYIDVRYVNYKDVIENPSKEAERINRFLDGNLDIQNMVTVVDKSLYRNKATAGKE